MIGVACGDSRVVPSSERVAASIATAVPKPAVEQPFEATLHSDDLAKFRGLPEEFQAGLLEEADENGYEVAAQYLDDLPDDAVPIADILDTYHLGDTYNLGVFGLLDRPYQRMLLLKGYPNSTLIRDEDKWRAGEITDVEYRFGAFQGMVSTMSQEFARNGLERLPSLEEVLSAAALAKFDSVDPIVRRAFQVMWESRTGESDGRPRRESPPGGGA